MTQQTTPGKFGAFCEQYGSWAVIAGASQGLGAEFAAQLAGRGLNLVLTARSETALRDQAARLAGEYDVQVRAIPADLSMPGDRDRLIAETSALQVGLLVYNAALSVIGPFLETRLEDHRTELETNCLAPLALAHHFGQQMLPRGRGGILLMSSLSSAQGSALIANYAATKSYNRILAEGLWEELRGQGIDVLACCAGAVSTPAYLRSLDQGPGRAGRGNAYAMPAGQVAREALNALGRQPSVIPGLGNRLAAFAMQRLMPHTAAIQLMGRVLRGMYGT